MTQTEKMDAKDTVTARGQASPEVDVTRYGSMDEVTDKDAEVLRSQGKTPELKRVFGMFSLLSLSLTLMATWEAVCCVFASGLIAGGPVSLVYGFILAAGGTLCACASLAEMASMAPTSAGQYHWIAQYSSSGSSAFLSWITAWISVFGWQAVLSSVSYLGAALIQGLLILNYPNYVYQRWHGTMMYWGITLLTAGVNTLAMGILPMLENMVLVCHILFYFLVLIPLVVVSPKRSASFVFTLFQNNSGWNSDFVAWCSGLASGAYVMIGFDGAVHMSEEIQNAPVNVPRAMIGTILINGTMGLTMLIALLFCIVDIDSLVNSATGFPVIQLFYDATNSYAAANAMTSPVIILTITATLALFASTSRLTWAFARDEGLPCHKFFAHVDPKTSLPLRSMGLTVAIQFILGFISIGSTTAFNAAISLATVSLYTSYALPTILLIIRRLTPDSPKNIPLQFGPFTLGRWGLPINIIASVYLIFTSIFFLFPTYQPVTALNMNYASAVLGLVIVFSLVWWFVKGRRSYVGPRVTIDALAPVTSVPS